MLTKDQAICIRTVDFSETSQVVTFFTRASGKIGAIAKGSKRPKSSFDGPIEMLSNGRIVFSVSNKDKLATLTEFESAPLAQALLHNNLLGLNCCLFAAELVNNLTDEHDPHPTLFDCLLDFLHNSVNARDRTEMLALLIVFQLALLKGVGLGPILSRCVNCKTPFDAKSAKLQSYFSSSANGLICRNCENTFQDKFRLTAPAVAALIDLKLLAASNETTLNEIEKLLIYHFTELIGHRPKMAKHVLNP
ncbi:MAG: DNA repair protein RecO [Sedimentisphaerales bacterium]|nr:DNA repair protein RecO [Sedimentisphaerales bacterium]